jgi:hypothetical protein
VSPEQHNPRTKADTLFGKIALEEGFLSEAQLRECLELQAYMDPPVPPLGVLLMRMGYLDDIKLRQIIEVQRGRLRDFEQSLRARREDNLFGKVVIRMGLAREDQVRACLELQDSMPERRIKRLGDLLVQKGVLTSEDIQKVLDFQAGLILYCPGCDREYNMVLFNAGSKISCYQCGARIRVPETKPPDTGIPPPAPVEEPPPLPPAKS